MRAAGDAFRSPGLVATLAGAPLAASLLFLLWALGAPGGAEGSFAAGALCLVFAGALGPFLYSRSRRDAVLQPPRRAALRCGVVALGGALLCGAYATATSGPVAAAAAVGAFGGLYAWTAGAVGDLFGLLLPRLARVAAAALAVLLLGTLLYWDDLFLLRATDRKASAATAFRLSAAAAASVTLDYDWPHARELYRNNETAESLAGVRRGGLGPFAVRTAGLGVAAAALSVALHAARRRTRWRRARS